MAKIKYFATSNKKPLTEEYSTDSYEYYPIDTLKTPIIGYTKMYTPESQKKVEQETIQESESDNITPPTSYGTGYIYNPPQQETEEQVKVPLSINENRDTKGKRYTSREEFIKELTEAYTKELSSRGIDTKYAKMLVAQDALESAWGTSSLSEVFNFGGIKATKDSPSVQKDSTEYNKNNQKYSTKDNFRKFKNLKEYVSYKIDLLNNQRYNAFIGDPNRFYHRVKAGGYATDPNYVSKLLGIYNSPIFSAKLGGKLLNRINLEVINKQTPNTKLFKQGGILKRK